MERYIAKRIYEYFNRGRKMYTISRKTKTNIERVLGIPIEKLTNMDMKEERSWVEKRNNSRLSFSKRQKYGIIGRGNPLLARRKIRTAADLEKKSKKFFGV